MKGVFLLLRILKAFLTSVGLFLIVLGIGAILLLPQVEDFLRGNMEETLTQTFGTPVRIESMGLSLVDRSIEFRQLRVMNPQSFREEEAMVCETLRIQFNPMTLLSSAPVLHDVQLDKARINYRYKAGAGTNIGQLSKASERYAAESGSNQTYQVVHLRAENAEVNFSTNLLPLASVGMRVVTIDLDDVHENSPANTAQIVSIFLRSLLRETLTLKGILGPVVGKLKE